MAPVGFLSDSPLFSLREGETLRGKTGNAWIFFQSGRKCLDILLNSSRVKTSAMVWSLGRMDMGG